jgi:hypothetical protein
MADRLAQNESPPLDSEDWEIVFQAYEGYPILAFILAQHLDFVRELIERGAEERELAVDGLDLAIEALQPFTDFRNADLTIYLSAVAGTLVPEQE